MLRSKYKAIRRKISIDRRESVARDLAKLIPSFAIFSSGILSFISYKEELDTKSANLLLLEKGLLYLPKVVGTTLEGGKVSKDMLFVEGNFGLEPPKVTSGFDTVLVPLLTIDCHGNRLGYGMGFYDKLLSKGYNSIGIGFREQFSLTDLPVESHDVRVDKICVL